MINNCLIVGASGEIGAAIAKQLASEGYQLLLHYNNNFQELNNVINELSQASILDIIHGDLSTQDGIETFLNMLHFPVSKVIFASGKSEYGLFQDTSIQSMDEMISIHMKAPWMITKHVIPEMLSNKSGHIVFITSIWGETGASCEVIYSSLKGAQNSFVKSLAKELGPSGVRVNAVSPGFIDTKMNDIFSNSDKERIIEEIPLRRVGKPDDVAHVVSFLLDEKSSYVHGEIINVTGSW